MCSSCCRFSLTPAATSLKISIALKEAQVLNPYPVRSPGSWFRPLTARIFVALHQTAPRDGHMVMWKFELATGHSRSGAIQIPGDTTPVLVFLLDHSRYKPCTKQDTWMSSHLSHGLPVYLSCVIAPCRGAIPRLQPVCLRQPAEPSSACSQWWPVIWRGEMLRCV